MNPMQAPNVGPGGRDFGNRQRFAPVAPVARTGYVWCNCKCCGQPFEARIADRRRGWGRFCSKSCKAVKQEQRTGQYSAYLSRRNDDGYYDDGDRLVFPSFQDDHVQP